MPGNRPLWTFAAALCVLSQAAQAGPSKGASTEIEAKVALEGSLERRLQAVLREALGSSDLIVIVNVSVRTEAERAESEVLPGVPAPQTSELAASQNALLPMVSRLSATIIIDEAVEAKDVELVKKIAGGILGIVPARGDSVTIEKIRFHKPVAKPDPTRYFPLGASALWLAFAVIAFALFQKRFLGPLIGYLRDIGAALLVRNQSAANVDDREPEPAAPLAVSGAPAAGEPSVNGSRPKAPFSFISEADLPKLAYILRDGDALAAATVIQYLPPATASKLLAALPPEMRHNVVLRLSRVSELNESDVRPFEEAVRQRIDYFIGGDDKLADLLESLPFDLQQELLATVRRDDPALADRISGRLIFLDDIGGLQPSELKLLSRRVPAKVLATVLKSSEALKASVLPKLAAGTREWLAQEIDLSPELTPAVLEAARRPVIAAVSQLLREGRIVLRKNGAAPAEPSAAPEIPAAAVFEPKDT